MHEAMKVQRTVPGNAGLQDVLRLKKESCTHVLQLVSSDDDRKILSGLQWSGELDPVSSV
jgi:hypothetical protein